MRDVHVVMPGMFKAFFKESNRQFDKALNTALSLVDSSPYAVIDLYAVDERKSD